MGTYKKSIIIGLVVSIPVVLLILTILNSPTYITHPEPGITCVATENYSGDTVYAGCYEGDVEKIGNTISHEATCKYQGLGC